MVAVKVQRPDMLQSVLLDIYIIRRLAQVVEKIKGVITSQRPYDVALVDTFATASLQELDYQQEASNQVSLSLEPLEPTVFTQFSYKLIYAQFFRRVFATT